MIDLKDVMPIADLDDWEMRLKRQDALWRGEILDRPFCHINFFELNPDFPFPQKTHATAEEFWLDTEYRAELALALVMNTAWMGDTLPTAFPDLGPDFFAACYGGQLRFTESTSFIVPFLKRWEDADDLRFDWRHPYFLKMEELYRAYLEIGKNRFYTGWPDLHPGGDCLVGFRGPANLAMDLIDDRAALQACLQRVTQDFLRVYDHYYTKLCRAGQPCTGWPDIVSTYKWHVPSNDFSYMISPADFDEIFLEGLREENRAMEANVHHLDGPGCRNHLDSLLGIAELNMIQWVWGAGRGRASDYLDLFRKIQAAGKGVQIQEVALDELDVILEALKPNGVWMHVNATNREEAAQVMQKIRRWK